MKTKFFAITLLMACIAIQRVAAQTLVLHHADGTTTDVELYTQPRVEFQGDRVIITSPVLDMYDPKDNILRFTYTGGLLGISSPKAEADYTPEDGRLVFHNVKATDEVAVYRPNGIRVPVRLMRNGTDAVLPLSEIPQGVYLLFVNGRTSKFTKP